MLSWQFMFAKREEPMPEVLQAPGIQVAGGGNNQVVTGHWLPITLLV